MAEKIADAVLEIRTDTKKLVKGMGEAKQTADKSMQKMQARADKFAKFMKGAIGIGGVVLVFNKLKRVVGDLVTAYGVQETAETKLKAAIKATGKEASISADVLFQYASELQGVTTYGDEATISAMAMLQQLGELNEEGLKAAIPLVQDFAAAMDVDLKTAASLVGKTLGSTTNALTRYGVEVDMSGTKQEKLASMLGALQKKFGGMAKQLGTTDTAALQQFNNALGDIKEEGGKAFLDLLAPMLRGMTRQLSLTLQNWKATKNLNRALDGESMTLDEVNAAIAENNKRTREAENRALGLARKVEEAQKAFDEEAESVKLGTNALTSNIGQLADRLQIAKDAIGLNATEIEQRVENIKYLENEKDAFLNENEVKAATVDLNATLIDQTNESTTAIIDRNIALEEHLSITEALSIAAAELRDIEIEEADAAVKATEDKHQALEDMAEYLSGPFREAYGDAFETLGQVMVEGGNALEVFREAFKKTIADMLTMLGKYLAIEFFKQAVALNFAGAALAAVGSAAAFTAAGAVTALTTGGDFETRGPQMIMVGDNPGGRERVTATPLSSPNMNGPGGQMVHVTVNVGSKQFYDDISRATDNGDIIVNPRSVKR